MNYTAAELLKKMPKNYRELKYTLYNEMMNNIMVEKPDTMDEEDFKSFQAYSMISILLDIPIDKLDQLPYTTMLPLINTLSFLNSEVVITYSTIKTKEIESLTFKEFQSLIQLIPDQFNNMDDILSIVIVDDAVDVNNLSVWEVAQIMGKLKNLSKISLTSSRISLAMKIIKMKMKQMMRIKD